jgi:hypothetical protein
MRNTLIAMSCLVTVSAIACTSSPKRVIETGSAGATGSAGSGSAGSGTAGSTGGTAGNTGGTAGNTGGTAGNTGGTAGAAAGTTGGTAGAGGDMDAGSTAGTTGGTAGAGTAGAGTAGDVGGTAGATVMVCNNATVVSAGGSAANCGPQSGWTATAMPTPPSGFDGIANSQLQPMYAIDGNTVTRYSSGATMMQGDYFEVDLGSAKMVSGIVVDTSEDATDVANGYEVDLSTDGTTFNKIAGCMYPAAPTETINFTATSARYIRYIDEGPPTNGLTSWLSIHEFNVTCN